MQNGYVSYQGACQISLTIQVAITLSGFLGSAFAADNFSEPLVDWMINMGVSIPRATLDAGAVIFITLVLSVFYTDFWRISSKENRYEKAGADCNGDFRSGKWNFHCV